MSQHDRFRQVRCALDDLELFVALSDRDRREMETQRIAELNKQKQEYAVTCASFDKQREALEASALSAGRVIIELNRELEAERKAHEATRAAMEKKLELAGRELQREREAHEQTRAAQSEELEIANEVFALVSKAQVKRRTAHAAAAPM